LQTWAAGGAETGVLGYPTGGEVCGLRGGGCLQTFQRGAVYWSPATGAHVVSGQVQQRWGAQGWEGGRMGYPVTDTSCGLADGGCWQAFQVGRVYSSASTGAHVVWGAILQTWAAGGAETGVLGYPTGGEVCGLRGGGCLQTFQRGAVYWSPATGAHAMAVGGLQSRWAATGWENGRLGYPVEAERAVPGGRAQRFQGGTLTQVTATGDVQVAYS